MVEDAALGFCILFLLSTILANSVAAEFLFNSSLGPQGVFFMFGGFSFVGFIYCWIFLKETKGLTDCEKKQLFRPKKAAPEEKS